MANARAKGRPIAPLELSGEERAYLERQVPYRHGQLCHHKTPKIRAWLTRRPHYRVHFTPTSASWINQVERWFAELTRKRLRRAVHTSVRHLQADIRVFIDRHNQNPKPFKWTKSADQILASVKRFCQKTQKTLCREL
jgi:transposase